MSASEINRVPVSPRTCSRAAVWALLVCACATLLAPLFVVDIPPLLDYPNHLARAWAIAGLSSNALLSSMFRTHWEAIPNLATDLLLPPLIGPFSVHVAGRMMLGVILVLPVLGCVAYARMLFGRMTVWSVASALVATHGLFLLGFMNFSFSVGLALLSAAAWGALRPRMPLAAAAAGACLSVALFFSHLMGVVFFAVLAGCREIESRTGPGARPQSVPRKLAGAAVAMAPILVPAVLLFELTRLGSLDLAIGWTLPLDKLRQLALPVVNYDPLLDAVTMIAILGMFGAALLARRVRMPLSTCLALATLSAIYLVLPFALKGTSFLDSRLPVMIGFLVFAGFSPRPLPTQFGRLAVLALGSLLLVRTVNVMWVWQSHESDLRDLREVIAQVEPGSNVLLASVSPDEAPAEWAAERPSRLLSNGQRIDQHIAALLLIERQAAWPFFFADPAQQPLSFTGRFAEAARLTPQMPNYTDIVTAFADPQHPTGKAAALVTCPLCFDYLLLLEAGYRPNFPGLPQARLRLVAANGFAALFQTRPSPLIATTPQAGEPREALVGIEPATGRGLP